MSTLLLLLFVSVFFIVWAVGLGTPFTLFVYNHSPQFVVFDVFFLLGLNIYKARGTDFFYLIMAILIFLFFAYFREERGGSIYGDLLISILIFIGLIVKWLDFDKFDRTLYFIIFYLFLGIMIYRVFTEIQIPKDESIWVPTNKLSDIWINTNTIGSTLMALVLLICGFANSFECWFMRLLALPALIGGFLTIWVCQSRGALLSLIVFTILEILPKELLKKMRIPFFAYLNIIIFALPISYLAAASDKINIFTGREDIWRKFYETILEKTEKIWVGMKPFVYQRGNEFLGNHNSYHSFANLYGLIGLLIIGLLLLIYIGHLTLNANVSNGQLTFIWSFLAVMIQSFMEDTLTSFSWILIVYLLLAMSVHRYDYRKSRKIQCNISEYQEEQQYSRVQRFHE